MSISSEFFAIKNTDDTTVNLLKQRLVSLEKEYKRMLLSMSDENSVIGSFNHNQIVKKFDAICNVKNGILAITNHDGLFIEL